MLTFPVLITIYAGFMHAFEADHLLAVSSIVSQRSSVRTSLKDGAFWGLGHSSTILLTGALILVCKVAIMDEYFRYFEALVGVMLILLAISRLRKFFRSGPPARQENGHAGDALLSPHSHPQFTRWKPNAQGHALAYGVGIIHGLAGSGALILIVMTQVKTAVSGMYYLSVFSLGCITGMVAAACLFSVPLSKRMMKARHFQTVLVLLSAMLCLLYGARVLYQNLIA